MGLFHNRTTDGTKKQVPVWFMRQAGRYHQHYQNIKKNSDFMTMCKNPELAEQITLGPIEEFDFDAAILFSDLLFPLEHLSMGLNYHQGPPKLEFHLEEISDLEKLKVKSTAKDFFNFQALACQRLLKSLPQNKSLLGFVGAPFTLYTYAVEGGHSGNLIRAKKGLRNGLFEGFCERLLTHLLEEMMVQAEAGCEAICLFDTAAGELDFNDYKNYIIPKIKYLTQAFKKQHPNTKIIYYSKYTHIHYLQALEDQNIDVLGIDWRVSLVDALKTLSKDYIIQGNLDPVSLHYPWEVLEKKWLEIWSQVQSSQVNPDRWICGLGHGVLQHTPESNVKKSVEFIHQHFRY